MDLVTSVFFTLHLYYIIYISKKQFPIILKTHMWIKFISNKDMLFLFVYKYVESVTELKTNC